MSKIYVFKKFDVTMTSQSAYCLSGENRILDEKNDKQQISLGNFPLIRSVASLPVQNKCFEKVWRAITSQSAFRLSRENRILDETNDKQQISLGNFPTYKTTLHHCSLSKINVLKNVWTVCPRWRHSQSIVSRVKIGCWTKQTINNRYHSVIFHL